MNETGTIESRPTGPKRCAVYCRVSTDERLDQSFNSIDAQREAGAAFIASQRAQGWVPVPDDYEDPGFTGGNMERPALKRLLQDIRDGKVDIVVVYKIDRLSRSLADFAKMVEIFDSHNASFSSVTQQINSATSMGRLMLNVLLSFAQFEREVTGERIRDKFAASKRKGMWMGGPVPLGYRVENRLLIVEPEEAKTVRQIFKLFVQTRSTTKMTKLLADQGITTKNGNLFTKQALYTVLHNRLYLGEIGHKGDFYRGQHEALIDRSQWEQAQVIMKENARKSADEGARAAIRRGYLLRGMLFTPQGDMYLPSSTHKPNGRLYRYYVVDKNQKMGAGTVEGPNLQANKVEKAALAEVLKVLTSGQMVYKYWEQITRMNADLTEPQAMVQVFTNMAAAWDSLAPKYKYDITRTLIQRVTAHDNGLEIQWRYEAWGALLGDPPKGTAGRELLEMEAA
jgi:DNA invertase Pin-like site-specific DNA recombinase